MPTDTFLNTAEGIAMFRYGIASPHMGWQFSYMYLSSKDVTIVEHQQCLVMLFLCSSLVLGKNVGENIDSSKFLMEIPPSEAGLMFCREVAAAQDVLCLYSGH